MIRTLAAPDDDASKRPPQHACRHPSGMKRFLDIFISSIALTALAIPLALIAALVRVKLGSPIFFRQVRPGIHGRPFEMVKFRTMTEGVDSSGRMLSDEERLTSFGRWLRATSLDELPELWNVFRGEMSLVGPRPLLMAYLPLYTSQQARRHEVRPGITGWAQVNGRNALSWQQKFELDAWYVDHRSVWLDIRILWMTLRSVIRREGISAAGEATMPAFTGNQGSRSEGR